MGTAKDKLKMMIASNIDPTVSDDEVDELLADAALCDAAMLPPGDGDWTPTYDLNAAASAGWLVKAARASVLTEVDPPGSGIVTSKVFENCRMMARFYAAKRSACVSVR